MKKIALMSLLVVMLAAPAGASDDLGRELQTECTVCHDKPGSKLLTDRGKYYETLRTFEGYDKVTEVFGACTTCHESKPGSSEMTETGQRFADLVDDMEELRRWLETEHPPADEQGPTDSD